MKNQKHENAKPGTASLSGRMVGYWIDPATGKVTSTRVVIGVSNDAQTLGH